jgi:hypothetical protein
MRTTDEEGAKEAAEDMAATMPLAASGAVLPSAAHIQRVGGKSRRARDLRELQRWTV